MLRISWVEKKTNVWVRQQVGLSGFDNRSFDVNYEKEHLTINKTDETKLDAFEIWL